MCVLDCSPAALKMLHNSTEFLPYVIFIASPGMEQLKVLYDVGRSNSNLRYSSRNLTVRDLFLQIGMIFSMFQLSVWTPELDKIQLQKSENSGISSITIRGKNLYNVLCKHNLIYYTENQNKTLNEK